MAVPCTGGHRRSRAPATFAVVFDSHAVNPALQTGLSFGTRKDLAAVSPTGTGAMVLATHAEAPSKTFADAVAAAKGGRGVSCGSIGSGSPGHLAMALLARSGGLDLVHVTRRGGGPLARLGTLRPRLPAVHRGRRL